MKIKRFLDGWRPHDGRSASCSAFATRDARTSSCASSTSTCPTTSRREKGTCEQWMSPARTTSTPRPTSWLSVCPVRLSER